MGERVSDILVFYVSQGFKYWKAWKFWN